MYSYVGDNGSGSGDTMVVREVMGVDKRLEWWCGDCSGDGARTPRQ